MIKLVRCLVYLICIVVALLIFAAHLVIQGKVCLTRCQTKESNSDDLFDAGWNEDSPADENDNSLDENAKATTNTTYLLRTKRELTLLKEPDVNKICSDSKNIFLLILINSAPQNFYLRWTIRQTWGKIRQYKGLNVRLAFVVGRTSSDGNSRTEYLLWRENQRTQDVIIGDFSDSYYNLTTKTLYGMQWVRTYCKNAQYVLKGDDDVLMAPNTVIEYILALPDEQKHLLYEGACQVNHKPRRKKNDKWYISEEDYPNATYPVYQLGVAVLHSYKALDLLYQACHEVPSRFDVPLTFPFDDVFVGICAYLTDIEPTCNNHIIVWKDAELRAFLRSRRQTCLLATTLAVHDVPSRRELISKKWRLLENIDRRKFNNCDFNFTTAAT